MSIAPCDARNQALGQALSLSPRFSASNANPSTCEAAMMGFFQDTGVGVGGPAGGGVFQYQRLEWREREEDGAAPARSRWRWLPAALNGKVASGSPCLFSVKKLKWGRITSALIPRKVAELSAKIRHAGGGGALGAADDVCPAVIFMSPWGLPVLSRPLLAGGHRSRYRHGRE
ncbi:unnamed protein product [Urochloa decumbens]|uniref:Uncharacterized protein n=1 Tax=Urochloa decumbens TaxID=240449 RepID=A0ABC9FI10_9POAL